MKTLKALFFFYLFALTACNGSTTQVPYSDPALVEKVNSLTEALATATHTQAEQALALSKLQLIGKVHGVVSAERTLAIGDAAAVPVSFGPCADMGVLIGRSGGSNAMTGNIQSFQTCTGYEYTVDSDTGSIQPLPSMEWDGANCTGTVYAPFSSIPMQLLSNGAVFQVPSTGDIVMVVPATQSLHPVIVSFEAGDICTNLTSPGPDIVYPIQANILSTTGVPDSGIPIPYSIVAP